MFEYCDRNMISITITIGKFLSHKVKWTDDEGKILDCEVINKWSRIDIATRYLEEYYCPLKYDKECSAIGGIQNREKFIHEVSLKIDELIPKRYFIKYHQIHKSQGVTDGTVLSSKFTGKDNHEETQSLIYKYNHNMNSEQIRAHHHDATEKQLLYLKYLAHESGYIIKNTENINTIEASEIIDFLLGNSEEPKNLFEYLEFE